MESHVNGGEPIVLNIWPGVGPDETIQISPEPETMSPALDRKKVEVNELIRMLTDVLKSTSDESPQLKAWQTLLVALHPQIDASRSLGGRKSRSPFPLHSPGKQGSVEETPRFGKLLTIQTHELRAIIGV